uniref:hypothetical protein n=1 Tax=Endozoicomonas sp. ONNA2 TaxID=2828741 RepID=UPI002148E682
MISVYKTSHILRLRLSQSRPDPGFSTPVFDPGFRSPGSDRLSGMQAMATTNIWQQFKALMPKGVRIVVNITAKNGNSTCQAELRDGSVITVKEESVNVGEKAFILDSEIKGTAPNLAEYEVEV